MLLWPISRLSHFLTDARSLSRAPLSPQPRLQKEEAELQAKQQEMVSLQQQIREAKASAAGSQSMRSLQMKEKRLQHTLGAKKALLTQLQKELGECEQQQQEEQRVRTEYF